MTFSIREKNNYQPVKCEKHVTCHPMCCNILPPTILTAIVKNGDQTERKVALSAIYTSEKFRTMRAMTGAQITGMRLSRLLISSPAEKDRTIYDAENKPSIGRIVRHEGDSETDDIAVNEAYDYSGKTYDFFKEVFGRNSIDNAGLALNSTVHFREDENEPFLNAAWADGRMWYGDGGLNIFNRFTIDLAVIGHELAHGVTEYEGDLLYQKDTGAINEHFSDVFGILVKQYSNNESAEDSNWLIGEGLWTDNIVNGKALRSLKEPGTAYGPDPRVDKDPQPAHMRDYVDFGDCVDPRECDYGGVHINSGILNKAFYNTAIEIGGKAWEAPGQIWYASLVNLPNNPDKTTFEDLANTTYAEAGKIYGFDSKEQKAVFKGWEDVGIKITKGSADKFLLSKGVRAAKW